MLTYSHSEQSKKPDTFLDIILVKASFEKVFEGEMTIRIHSKALLQIFREHYAVFSKVSNYQTIFFHCTLSVNGLK